MMRAILLAGLLVALPLLLGCQRSVDERPNLILIVVDNLRADRVGAYGYARPTTPTLDALARDGILFEHAVSTSSWTKPSVASLFTSRLPSEHGAVDFAHPIDSGLPTMAERLAKAGYVTVGLSANFVHIREGNGFDRGFASWRTSSRKTSPDAPDLLWGGYEGAKVALRATPGGALTEEALELLPAEPDGPVFLYVHYMDPHVPWIPDAAAWARLAGEGAVLPSPVSSREVVDLAAARASVDATRQQQLRDAYDAEVARADDAIAALLRGLEARGICGKCVVAVTADHGEEFYDHGGWFHGLTLFGEVARVPMIVRDFRQPANGRRISAMASLLDIAPTFLKLGAAPVPPSMRGVDLLAPLPEGRTLVAELHADESFVKLAGPPRHRLALWTWPWKVLRETEGAVVVHQLEHDAAERQAISATEAAPTLAAGELVDQWLGMLAGAKAEKRTLSPADEEALRALGYME